LQYKLIGNDRELFRLFINKVYKIYSDIYINITRYNIKIDYLMYVIANYMYTNHFINCKYIIYTNLVLSTNYLVYGYNQKNIQYNIKELYYKSHGVIQYNNNVYTMYYDQKLAIISFDLYGNIINYYRHKYSRDPSIRLFKGYTDIELPQGFIQLN
jgi:hypothetical protein